MADVFPNAGISAAQMAGESAEMDIVAEKLAALARAEAMKHNDSGTFAGSIRVRKVRGKRGVSDRLIEATDPLAAVKELGHAVQNEKDGPVLGFVKGQHSMGNAIRRMPRVSDD